MTLEPATPIGLLCVLRPDSIPLLRRMGIALDSEHRATLAQACAARGLDADAVVRRLSQRDPEETFGADAARDPIHELQRLRPRIGSVPAPWEQRADA